MGTVEVLPSHVADVGGVAVRRALPQRARRTVGAWCFVDHMGPLATTEDWGLAVGPHPHLGLQTVTWVVSGEIEHRDSLGSVQVIRPGQLNLMTAGRGVSHAEETVERRRGEVQAVQLWVAQPEDTRHGAAAFEHHAELPKVELDSGTATVFVGGFGAEKSPARRDTEIVGVELDLSDGASTFALDPSFEYAAVVLEGALRVGEHSLEPGNLGYLGLGRGELAVGADGPTRALLLGGVPFPEPVLMWWNFVARTREEISAAWQQWQSDSGQFGEVNSHLTRIPVGPPPWMASGG